MKKTFISFGGGDGRNNLPGYENIKQALSRLISEIEELDLFDEIIAYTDSYLKSDENFWTQHENFIKNNKQGYGLYIWKPYIIKKTMEKMNDGDILMYADAGCVTNRSRLQNFKNCFKYVVDDKLLWNCYNGFREINWCKKDLIEYLNAYEYLNTYHRQAGVIMVYVCDKTRKFIDEYYNVMCNYYLIDNSPSKLPNYDDFVNSRHDQSVFSLLSKKHNFNSNNDILQCITALRNKTGNSK